MTLKRESDKQDLKISGAVIPYIWFSRIPHIIIRKMPILFLENEPMDQKHDPENEHIIGTVVFKDPVWPGGYQRWKML